MRILLTGASGLVGSAFSKAAARRGHTVVGVVGSFQGKIDGLTQRLTLDLTDRDAVTRLGLELFPDVIVNCAAISEPAACEVDPVGSERMNVQLPGALAQLSHHLGARLLHISSEQVFDGTQSSLYGERHPVAPINLYGRQKVASEQAVLTGAPHTAAIVRAPLLIGGSPGGRRGLHERLFGNWSAGRVPRLYTDEYRQPCSGENLAEVLLELVERPDICGVFHWAGSELISRHGLGLRVREHFKLMDREAPIVAVTRAEVPDLAQHRQACLALDISSLAGRLKTRPETVAEQLSGLGVPQFSREWYHDCSHA